MPYAYNSIYFNKIYCYVVLTDAVLLSSIWKKKLRPLVRMGVNRKAYNIRVEHKCVTRRFLEFFRNDCADQTYDFDTILLN